VAGTATATPAVVSEELVERLNVFFTDIEIVELAAWGWVPAELPTKLQKVSPPTVCVDEAGRAATTPSRQE
jgi:hypothetical protein